MWRGLCLGILLEGLLRGRIDWIDWFGFMVVYGQYACFPMCK